MNTKGSHDESLLVHRPEGFHTVSQIRTLNLRDVLREVKLVNEVFDILILHHQ